VQLWCLLVPMWKRFSRLVGDMAGARCLTL